MTPEIDILIQDELWNEEFDNIEDATKEVVSKVLKQRNYSISIVLTNNQTIQDLNKNYRGKNKPTNVLSFPQDHESILGDVIIALETIKSEAKEQEKKLEHHYKHMLIHGTLHLLGYDHETEKEAYEMEKIEIEILQNFGITNPYETN